MLFTVFTNSSHIVAIRTTGNVYAHEVGRHKPWWGDTQGVGLGPRRSRAKSHGSSKGWWPACGLQAWTRQLYPLSGS